MRETNPDSTTLIQVLKARTFHTCCDLGWSSSLEMIFIYDIN